MSDPVELLKASFAAAIAAADPLKIVAAHLPPTPSRVPSSMNERGQGGGQHGGRGRGRLAAG